MIALSWLALAMLCICNVLLGRVWVRPPVRPEGSWTERRFIDGRSRVSISTIGASILAADLNVLDPAWLQILLVAAPSFAIGLAWGRRRKPAY